MSSDPLAVVRAALERQDWQRAFDRASAACTTEPAEEAERRELLAVAAWWLGRIDECIEARQLAFQAFDAVGDRHRAGACAAWLWEHHMMRLHPSLANAWLRRARSALAGQPEGYAHGVLLLREAELAHGSGDLPAAREQATRALELGRRLGSADIEAEALQTLGRIALDDGDTAEGLGLLDEAMLFAVEGRLGPYSTGKVYCSLISACEQVGDLDRAAEWTEATLRWAEQHPFAIFPGICRVHRAVVLKTRGCLRDAEQEASRACKELLHSHTANSATAFAQVGDIRRRLGDYTLAEEAFERARELSGQPCGALALLRLAQGRSDAALSIITQCLSQTTNPHARADLLPVLVQVGIAADRSDLSVDALAELDGVVAAHPSALARAGAAVAHGRLALARGEPDRALDALVEAADCWRALDVPYELATTRTLMGEALRAAGDDDAAASAFAEAARQFELIGARVDAARAAGEDSAPTLPDGLTNREVEVLRLIAAGHSNSAIATELFLSPKTVSRHLSNIFTKIGVGSRSAATAYAFQHELVARPH